MKKIFSSKTLKISLACLILAGLTCAGIWFLSKHRDGIANTENPTDEQFKQYFAEYAEATSENNPENILIVTSEGRPKTHGAVDIVEAPNHTYFLMYASPEARDIAFNEFETDNTVSVEKNTKMQLMDYGSWGVPAMGLDKARETIGYGGNSVRIAIIDTGLDMELFQQYYPNVNVETYDIETGSASTPMIDKDGHGTHIAGTIAEGMPKTASLYIIRAARGDDSELYSADVVTAVNKASYEGARVINMSLGSYDYSRSHRAAIEDALSNGTLTVAAAGNDGIGTVAYPAGYDNTIAVSAVGQDLTLASYSNYGTTIDFAAPGSYISSINGIMSGTSMAAPHVSAAVATLKSFNTSLRLDTTKTLLAEHVRDLGEPGWDQQFGHGLINFSEAKFCERNGYCDQYGVFATDASEYTKMEIDEVTLTPVNYYSISNLMLTEVKLYTDETNYVTKKLQDVRDLTITGYGAETHGLQTVTIACEGLSETVYVVNPENYTPGWEYRLDQDDQILLSRYYDVLDYDDDHYDVSISKLYVPEQINGKNVVELTNTRRTVQDDDYSYETTDTVFERSSYANRALKEIYLPDALTVISDDTFYLFRALEKIVMSDRGVRVGKWAFYNAYNLETVEGRIVELGEYAFLGDELLKTVELSEGITTIPDSAFNGCYSLKRIVIPSTVTEIGFNAFSNNRSLEQVTFSGNNLRLIDRSAFYKTTALKNITLPDGLEAIRSGAFAGSALTSIRIPASVTEIDGGAFYDNDNLATIIVDTGNQKYYDVGNKALMYDEYSEKVLLSGTNSFIIPVGTTRIGYDAFAGFKTVGRLVIPDSVKVIDGSAFLGCTGLTEIYIPKLARDVGSNAFEKKTIGEWGYSIYVPLDAKLWVYYEDEAYNYATERGFNYQTIDASYARVVNPFNYGDTLDNMEQAEFYYDYGTLIDGVFTNHTGLEGLMSTKTTANFTSTEYSGAVEFFRIGDAYFTAVYKDLREKDATTRVAVTVNGEYPEYTVPTGLTAKLRAYLYDIALPAGFSWMEDEYTYLYELGEHTFMAMYTPENLNMYAPIENIAVVVETVPGRAKLPEPIVTIDSKTYDGEWQINPSLIHVSIEGLDEDDFTVDGWLNNNEVGTTTAWIHIYLDWDVAENYGFGDNYDWVYSTSVEGYEILPADEPELEVDNRTKGLAEVTALSDGIEVTAGKACAVVVTNDSGATYTRISAVAVDGEENTYKFTFEISSNTEVIVALRGDGDFDGTISTGDSNLINRSLISASLRPYRALSSLEKAVLDLDGSGTISTSDSNLLNRSLISTSLRPYKAIEW